MTADKPDAYRLGLTQLEAGHSETAATLFAEAIIANPDSLDPRLALGVAFRRLGRFEDAVAAYRAGLALNPHAATLWGNLGNALKDLEDPAAIDAHLRAIGIEPGNGRFLHNLGIALALFGRHQEALGRFDQARAILPDDAEVAWDRARSLLALGHYAEGWPAYESRWALPAHHCVRMTGTEWNGKPFRGKRLYLYAEQGLGDTVQCLRFLPQVKQLGGTVIVEIQPPLATLTSQIPGIDQLVVRGSQDRPAYDLCLSLLDLPRFFAPSPDALSPAPYLHPPADRSDRFARFFDTTNLKIGIVWSGSVTFKANRFRAVTLPTLWRAMGRVPGVTVYSLQKGPPEQELAAHPDIAPHIIDLGPHLHDLADTAEVLRHLDLVIMTDSSVAHLAGAVGCPVWVLLGSGAHWLWLCERDDSPWYGSMTLYRQARPGDWPSLMEDVRRDLQHLAESRTTSPRNPQAFPDTAAAIVSHRRDTVVSHRGEQSFAFNRWDRFAGRSVAVYGTFASGERRLLHPFLLPGDPVVEIGAGIGILTAFLAQAVGPHGTVHAFEPHRIRFQTLCTNLILNGIDWVRCHPAAAGEQAGMAEIPVRSPHGLAPETPSFLERVAVTPIDHLDLAACRMMIIGAEGMETKVLTGARATISRCRPILYVENDRREQSPALIAFLQENGYQLWWHTPDRFDADNPAGYPVDIFGRTVSVHVLALPDGRQPGRWTQSMPLRPVTGPQDWWRDSPSAL